MIQIEDVLGLDGAIHVADIGAAAIAETPPYKPLLDRGLATLSAFDADPRHRQALLDLYGERAQVYTEVIGDGARRPIHFTAPASGMSSLLKPSPRGLGFFNGFAAFGAVEREAMVDTRRLDDIAGLADIDFLKMDIQGAELMVLRHGGRVLRDCVAFQLEVSFAPLYEDQPSFGEIDLWMRANGYAPHTFVDVKRWSIHPTIRSGQFRYPFNQLLEADVVYVRNPLHLSSLSDRALSNLALIAHHAYASIDLAARLMLELERRATIPTGSAAAYVEGLGHGLAEAG